MGHNLVYIHKEFAIAGYLRFAQTPFPVELPPILATSGA